MPVCISVAWCGYCQDRLKTESPLNKHNTSSVTKDKVLSAFVLYNGFSSTNYDTICSLSLTTFHQIDIQSNKP